MKSVELQSKGHKAISVLDGERLWVGVDVHKRSYHVALWSDTRGLVGGWVQPARPEVLGERLQAVRTHVAQVVYEAGPTGYGLVRWLREAGYPAEVIAPAMTPQLPGKQAKSDRLDCGRLAMLAGKGLLQPVAVPSEQEEADRQVLRAREQAVRRVRRVKQQIKAFLLQYGIAEPPGLEHWTRASLQALRALSLRDELRFCLEVLLDELEHAVAQRERINARAKALAGSARHREAVQQLRSVPCVGVYTAMTWRTELFDPQRFDRAEQVARMLGLAPCIRQSGEQRHAGRLMKSGNWRMRTLLVEAAWRWIRVDERARRDYQRLLHNTGSAKKAITGVARKLGIVLWRMSLSGERYRLAA